jgi:hypothetical protein
MIRGILLAVLLLLPRIAGAQEQVSQKDLSTYAQEKLGEVNQLWQADEIE